jgi:hypothetical protein
MEDPNPIPGEPAAPLSLTDRLTGVFANPGEVFDSVKAGPPAPANWLVPALLYLVVAWAGVALFFSQPTLSRKLTEIQFAAIDQQIAAQKIPETQANAMRQAVEITTKIGMAVSPVFIAFLTPFWSGLLLWGVGRLVFKAHFGYLQAVEVAGLSNLILVLASLVQTLLVIGLANPLASPGPVLLLKNLDPSRPSFMVLTLLNVFTLWVLGLRALGLARLAGVTFARAAAWVFGLWIVLNGSMLGLSLAAQTLIKSLQPH